jgi:hypothetical protein
MEGLWSTRFKIVTVPFHKKKFRYQYFLQRTCQFSIGYMHLKQYINFVFFVYYLKQDLTIQPRLSGNLRSSCLSFPSAKITGVGHYTHLVAVY